MVIYTSCLLNLGFIVNEWPVHARRAFRCANIQSTVPLSWSRANEVTGDLTETNADTGLVEDIYTRQMRLEIDVLGRSGVFSLFGIEMEFRVLLDETAQGFAEWKRPSIIIQPSIPTVCPYTNNHTFSGFPLSPTRVPRLVYRFWDAESDTESREYGEPTTSNFASLTTGQRTIQFKTRRNIRTRRYSRVRSRRSRVKTFVRH